MGLGSIGSVLNDTTGASSAAAQSQKYALQSAKLNNKYQKEFAKNAHQWEVQDLQKAGLNPILSAGGGGASASGGGVASATEQSAGLSPIDAIGAGISAYAGIQNAKQIKAQTQNIDANTLYTKAKTQSELLDVAYKTKANPTLIEKLKTDLQLTVKQIDLIKSGKAGSILGSDAGGKIADIGNKGLDWLTGLFSKGE